VTRRLPSRLTDRDRLTIVMVAAPIVRPYVARYSYVDIDQVHASNYLVWFNGLVGPAETAVREALGLPSRRRSETDEIHAAILRTAEAIHHEREHMIPVSEAGYPVLESVS
jgi:hypothetical protein